MYKNIVVATDGSELAMRGVVQATELAKLAGAALTIVTVSEPAALAGGGYAGLAGTGFDPLPELVEAQTAQAKAVLAAAVAKAAEAGITAKDVYIDNRFPAEGIIETADKVGADLIVIASHGRRGLGRLLLGSQTSEVLAHTKIAVLVTR